MVEPFTITELAVGVGTVIGAISACLLVCFKSRCKNISICFGMLSLERKIKEDDEKEEEGNINNL